MPGSTDWFANADFIVLAPGETATLLDVNGPGAITRIWSASPNGLLRVYIDGEANPSIEGNLDELLSGATAPFMRPFTFSAAGGSNLYFPIPFRSSCRVTLTGFAATYYQINYRSFSGGTSVESFSLDAAAASHDVMAAVAERLSDPGATDDFAGRSTQAFTLSTKAAKSAAVISSDVGGVLCEFRLRPDERGDDRLRTTLLSIEFDGTETVHVPLGDFFASGVQPAVIDSIPIGVSADGVMTSRWPMPFQHEARISIQSTGGADLDAALTVVTCPGTWTDRSMYFYAQWHAPETFPSNPPRDWTLAAIAGDGVYVGDVLNVVNRDVSWWGEGDEKIYVDGEAFPSDWGTGTEDYYGYAWCSNEPFTTPYIGQPLAPERQNFGYTTLYRFHILDAIPFRKSLRFDLEVFPLGNAVAVTYDATSFWYARAGSHMDGTPADATAFRVPPLQAAEPDVAPGPYTCSPF